MPKNRQNAQEITSSLVHFPYYPKDTFGESILGIIVFSEERLYNKGMEKWTEPHGKEHPGKKRFRISAVSFPKNRQDRRKEMSSEKDHCNIHLWDHENLINLQTS